MVRCTADTGGALEVVEEEEEEEESLFKANAVNEEDCERERARMRRRGGRFM